MSEHTQTPQALSPEELEQIVADFVARDGPTIPESQIVEWVRQLSPKTKQAMLRVLIPELDELESLVNYGGQRARQLCVERGIDWDSLDEDERQKLVDEWLHEA